jgi:hypothetical protein
MRNTFEKAVPKGKNLSFAFSPAATFLLNCLNNIGYEQTLFFAESPAASFFPFGADF